MWRRILDEHEFEAVMAKGFVVEGLQDSSFWMDSHQYPLNPFQVRLQTGCLTIIIVLCVSVFIWFCCFYSRWIRIRVRVPEQESNNTHQTSTTSRCTQGIYVFFINLYLSLINLRCLFSVIFFFIELLGSTVEGVFRVSAGLGNDIYSFLRELGPLHLSLLASYLF